MSEKQYEVIITPFAESSLQDYDDYYRYELWADQTADHFLDRMEQEMQGLSFLPSRYPPVDREPWYSNGIRFFPVIGYNIYYWVNEARMRVYVTDVVSQKMDQDKRLIESMVAFSQIKDESDEE